MGIFDGILGNLGNLDDLAAKLGLPADKLGALTETLQSKLGQGGDHIAALTEAAKEHGVSLDSLKGLIGGAADGAKGIAGSAGDGAQDILGKVTGFLDKDGDGNPLNDLGDIAKGLFGKK